MPIQLAIGAEDNFEGVIDLIKMKAIIGMIKIWEQPSRKRIFLKI